jgi:hypothetical protein
MNWSELVEEVHKRGFNASSSVARLVYSCETGRGIDQHAAPDLKIIIEQLAAYRKVAEAAKKLLRDKHDGEPENLVPLDDALWELDKVDR